MLLAIVRTVTVGYGLLQSVTRRCGACVPCDIVAAMGLPQYKVLVVDDDAGLRDLLQRYLAREGYAVDAVADGQAMHETLAVAPPDVIVLDLMLPGDDGLALVRTLKSSKHAGVPVLMLSARGEDIDRVVGLEMGADDYLTKPFNPRELLARIRALLRRVNPPTSAPAEVAHFGPYRVNLAARTLWRGEAPVTLTSSEFSLLQVFLQNPRSVLSRDQLLEQLKGYSREPFDRSIDVRVTRLRRKLEDDPQQPRYIRTVWGVGYLFAPEGDPPA